MNKRMIKYRVKFFIFKLKFSPLYNWRKIKRFKKMSKLVKSDISKYDKQTLIEIAISWERNNKLFSKDSLSKRYDETDKKFIKRIVDKYNI